MADVAFDVAVLMGSQSDDVFNEYVDMHTGAKRLRRFWQDHCQCGDSSCFRETVQLITELAYDDAEAMLWFIDSFSKSFEPVTESEFMAAVESLKQRVRLHSL